VSAADDALDVARFCWPEHEWDLYPGGLMPHARRRTGALLERDRYVYWRATSRSDIAVAERVLVERGLGQMYVDELIGIYAREVADTWPYKYDVWALVAPLDARLRALARVVREQQPKGKA